MFGLTLIGVFIFAGLAAIFNNKANHCDDNNGFFYYSNIAIVMVIISFVLVSILTSLAISDKEGYNIHLNECKEKIVGITGETRQIIINDCVVKGIKREDLK